MRLRPSSLSVLMNRSTTAMLPYLATAPKSNSGLAFFDALATVEKDCDRNYWMDAPQSIEYGVADKILEKLGEGGMSRNHLRIPPCGMSSRDFADPVERSETGGAA